MLFAVFSSKNLDLYIGWTGPLTVAELDSTLDYIVKAALAEGREDWMTAIKHVNKFLLHNMYGTRVYAIPAK